MAGLPDGFGLELWGLAYLLVESGCLDRSAVEPLRRAGATSGLRALLDDLRRQPALAAELVSHERRARGLVHACPLCARGRCLEAGWASVACSICTTPLAPEQPPVGPDATPSADATPSLSDPELDRPTSDGQTPELAPGHYLPRHFAPGQRVGRFVLERVLGQGGMGVVWEARDGNGKVALKLMTRRATPAAIERFREEARLARRLDHPGIVQLLDADPGGAYIAFELVRGRPLGDVLEGGAIPLAERLVLFERIAAAIHHAHRRGVAHRDLKPSNILVDENGLPKVCDFGLARDLDVDRNLTRSGLALGTPSYLSPEQATGDRHAVSARTDVYALGLLLYELVTGSPSNPGTTLREIVANATRANVPRPSSHAPGLDPGFDRIVARACARVPGERYATAADLAEDVRRHRTGEVGATLGGEPERHPAQLGRYRLVHVLGRGRSGTVYKALDPSGREVALKLLLRTDPQSLARFEREARLLQVVSREPGFVELLELSREGEVPFLAMAFAPGGTLRDRLEEGAIDPRVVAPLGVLVAGALGRAHARGIVHRDLKPENIVFGEDGSPLIADLGLAKHYDRDVAGATETVTLTRQGQFCGTAVYAAPEQIADARSVGAAADVFALCAVLYECLAGEPPFFGENVLASLLRARAGRFVPLRERAPKVSSALATVVESGLSVDPTRRPSDGAELAGALGEASRRARPDPGGGPGRRPGSGP